LRDRIKCTKWCYPIEGFSKPKHTFLAGLDAGRAAALRLLVSTSLWLGLVMDADGPPLLMTTSYVRV